MLDQGIIEESNSPWMAPTVFVRKKTGDPLPLPDEVQDRLAVFSTLDLQSGYWQFPVSIKDREKTAFCPGPGMGLLSVLPNAIRVSRGTSIFSEADGQNP